MPRNNSGNKSGTTTTQSEKTVHIYVLNNKNSPMISSMWSIWSNIHIKGTLNYDANQNNLNVNNNNSNNNNNGFMNGDAPTDRRRRHSSVKQQQLHPHKPLDIGKVERLFGQLSREILAAASAVEDDRLEKLYILIKEMRVGAQRNYALKKLFWRRTNALKVKNRTGL